MFADYPQDFLLRCGDVEANPRPSSCMLSKAIVMSFDEATY